ncbi:hypothetical protein [uncultured Robinsoniella sp.]|uniref:hypothetical protein n=1 Tax=uncultured Robinsoniella sp. TaxID=904190 RepID=UPI0029088DBF|nr:hypothetical protein [Clostridiales bacterium]
MSEIKNTNIFPINEKTAYHIYSGIMKIHKKYLEVKPSKSTVHLLILDINCLNETHQSNLCNSMTEIIRQEFMREFDFITLEMVKYLYTDLWRFHKKYFTPVNDNGYWGDIISDAKEISEKYNCRFCNLMLLAIEDELDINWTDKYGSRPKVGA